MEKHQRAMANLLGADAGNDLRNPMAYYKFCRWFRFPVVLLALFNSFRNRLDGGR
jgi:hypothetical protein